MLLGWQPFWGALVQLNPTYQALPLGNKTEERSVRETVLHQRETREWSPFFLNGRQPGPQRGVVLQA